MRGVSRCVGDSDRFLRQHWSKAPLHVPGVDDGGFADLLSLDDVDHLVSSTFLRLPAFRLVRDGTPLDPAAYTRRARMGGRPVSGVADPGRVYEEFAKGATIVLQGLHRFWAPLARFARQLELELTHRIQVNAYVTPPAARGLAVHYDTHDVFVLQFGGVKQWSVHEPVFEDPLPSQPWSRSRGAPAEPCLSVELREGDSLYVPRGFPHSAQAQEGISGHLTVGVLADTWADLLRAALAEMDDELDFRRSLPVGYAHDPGQLVPAAADHVDKLRQWLEKLDVGAVAERTARRFWSSRPPLLAGQLRQLPLLDHLTDASRVRRREGTVCRLGHADDGRLRVLLGDRELDMPAALEPAVRRLTEQGGLRVGDLADELDGPSRLVLVRRLVSEGLLEVVDLG